MNYKTVFFFITLLVLVSVPAWGHHVGVEPNPQVAKAEGLVKADEQEARQYFTDLPLVDQDGKSVRFYTDVLKDKVVLISFVYTQCKDACPLLTHKLTLVRDMMEGQIGNPIQFVSISLDPQRDTPAALKKFARTHNADHAGWVFLTGEPKNIERIVKKLGQYTADLQSHSTLMLAGNVKTARWAKIPPMVPPAGIAEKLRMLAEDG
jgi:cytochrome oxidase Cu insertion factor (SCO1/SenC/PrrC family)